MNRSLQRIALGFVPATIAALVLWVPAAAPVGIQKANLAAPVGLQNVNLACSDGTNLALALDFDALTQLTDAVSAINLYPAGDPALTCRLAGSTGLSTGASFSAASSPDSVFASNANENGPEDFLVGGGQYMTGCGITNFSISAHAPDGMPGAAKGTWNISVPTSSLCGQGSFTAKVDCLAVLGPLFQELGRLFAGDDGLLEAALLPGVARFAGLQLLYLTVEVHLLAHARIAAGNSNQLIRRQFFAVIVAGRARHAGFVLLDDLADLAVVR